MGFPWRPLKTPAQVLYLLETSLLNCKIAMLIRLSFQWKNLENGKWLITSASDQNDMFMSKMRKINPVKEKRLPGCKTCGIESECGTEIETRFIEIRADMISCCNDTAIRYDFNLRDCVQHLLSKFPSLNDMPHILTTQAHEQMIEEIPLNLATVHAYRRKSFQKLDELTEPIALDMTIIWPSLRNIFTASSTWHMTILIGFFSFLFSNGVQFLLGYFCFKYKIVYTKCWYFLEDRK